MDKIMSLDHPDIIKALELVPVEWVEPQYQTPCGLFRTKDGWHRCFKNQVGDWANGYSPVDEFQAAALMEKCWTPYLVSAGCEITYWEEVAVSCIMAILIPGRPPGDRYRSARTMDDVPLALARAIIAVKGEKE